MTLLRDTAVLASPTAGSSSRPVRLWSEARGGVWPLLLLAAPLVVSTGCFALTLFVDRTLLLWFDPDAAAAALAAGNLYWTAACLPVMAVGYLSTMISQADGRSQKRAMGPAIWQAIWATLAIVPFCIAGAIAAGPLFLSLGHAADLAATEATYFRFLMLVAPGAMLEAGLSAFFVGRGRTHLVMRANIVATVVNLVADVVLIFGFLGFPSLGPAGAAIATAAAMWLKVAIYAAGILRQPGVAAEFGFDRWRFSPRVMGDLLGGGGTLGVQQMLRSGAISGVLVAVGSVSTSALAASSLVMSLFQLVTIPLIGLGTAVTVLSGRQMTRTGTPQAAWPIVSSGLLVGLGLMLVPAAAAVLVPETIVRQFAAGPAAEKIVALLPLARPLLALAAGLLVLEVISQLAAAALRGLGAVRSLLAITAVPSVVVFVAAPLCVGQLVLLWSLLLVWTALQAVGCLVVLACQPVELTATLAMGRDEALADAA